MPISDRAAYDAAIANAKVTMTVIVDVAPSALVSMAARCAGTRPTERASIDVTTRNVCGGQQWFGSTNANTAAVVTKATGGLAKQLTTAEVQSAIDQKRLGRLVDDAFLAGY